MAETRSASASTSHLSSCTILMARPLTLVKTSGKILFFLKRLYFYAVKRPQAAVVFRLSLWLGPALPAFAATCARLSVPRLFNW
jgi:hypothetical protein